MSNAQLLDKYGNPLERRPVIPSGAANGSRYRAGLAGGRWSSITPYDAADPYSAETRDWWPWLGSPDTENNPFRDFLVARIRDLVRNDGWACGAITRLLDNAVGGGFRHVAMPDWQALAHVSGNENFDLDWAKEYARAAQAEFRLWSTDIGRYCDLARRLSWGEITRLGMRQYFQEGEPLGIVQWRPHQNARFATCVQMVDPDRLSNPYLEPDQPHLRGGVEIDEDGVAIAYHIRRAHQAQWMIPELAYTWERVERETDWGRPIVIHCFESDRATQHRGAGGVLRPVLARLKMLARYDSVELQAAILNAVLAAWIESPYDPETVGSALEAQVAGDIRNAQLGVYENLRSIYHDDPDNNIALNNVRVSRLYSGEKMSAWTANRPSAAFDNFEAAMLRNAASAIGGISYEQLSQDWSRSNYSSARASLLESWKAIGRMRMLFTSAFCAPIYSCVLEEAHDAGRLPMPDGSVPGYQEMRSAYAKAKWMGPGRGWVDPVKEAQAAVLRMDAGLSTLEIECGEQGLDGDETFYERLREYQRWKESGMPMPKWFGAEQGNDQDSADAHRLVAKPQPQ